ncbi:glycosyltransferase family 1 protein [Propionibacterium sp.]|uniref:glycosyltransferase family 1 protein n=1 Tax=Propionibacterium sp. TaxID=1977903 RepID=UPI0039EC1AEA
MTIAIKYGALVDEPLVDDNGTLAIHGGAGAIVERLLKIFPGACLVGFEQEHCTDVEIKRLVDLDAENDLVINLDVMDSVGVFQTLHRRGAEPLIMNLQWLPPRHYHHRVNFAAMGLSYALFPTLCSGERTATEVAEVAHRWAIAPLANEAKIAWFQPGIRDDLLQPRKPAELPVVLYPTIHVSADKQPKVFMSIMSRVAANVPLQMEAHLGPRDLVTLQAVKMSSPRWAKVGPLSAERDTYWESLAHVTAFLSTSQQEAYGLEYLEALLAGAVGVLPKAPWATALLPPEYPYLYDSEREAAEMLEQILRDPPAAQAKLDACADGSITQWILSHHARATGNDAIVQQIESWFPNQALTQSVKQ